MGTTLHKFFLFKLEPNGAQARACACSCGCSRYVYNRGLAWLIEQLKQNPEFRVSYFDLTKLLTQWKQEEDTKWLAKCRSQVLQQSLKDLERGYINYKEGRANFPKFHKKFKSKDSFRYPQGFKIDEGKRQIYLPKIGWVKYHRSRFIAGKAKSITVSRKADGWYVSILTEQEVDEPRHPASGIEVGLDVGVVNTVTLSDGTAWPPINALRNNLEKLKKWQKNSNIKPGSQGTGRNFRQRLPGSIKGLPIHDTIISGKSPVMSARTTQSSTARI